jgi:glycosyltransferase involved in cell wall biosynthesis
VTTNKRTVFIVAPGGLREPAGIGRLVTSAAKFWDETGTGPAFRVIDPYGPAFLPLAPFYFARALLQIVWNARRGRVALLHVHMATRGSAVRKGIIVHLAARLGVPVILHLHSGRLEKFYRLLPELARREMRRTLNRADRVVALGEYWRRFLVEDIGVDPARVSVLPNAVVGPPDLPARAADGPCRLIFLGRLLARKGLPELLEALADPRVAGLSWSLRVVGRGDANRYRRQAAALGIGDRVELTGWVPESQARAWLADSDVFVLPSHYEGLSMALLEAMAIGLAAIVTPVGATPDAVVDGVSGLLVPVGDRAALAASLARVIGDRSLRAALQSGARQAFRERFDIRIHCQRLESLYGEVSRQHGDDAPPTPPAPPPPR